MRVSNMSRYVTPRKRIKSAFTSLAHRIASAEWPTPSRSDTARPRAQVRVMRPTPSTSATSTVRTTSPTVAPQPLSRRPPAPPAQSYHPLRRVPAMSKHEFALALRQPDVISFLDSTQQHDPKTPSPSSSLSVSQSPPHNGSAPRTPGRPAALGAATARNASTRAHGHTTAARPAVDPAVEAPVTNSARAGRSQHAPVAPIATASAQNRQSRSTSSKRGKKASRGAARPGSGQRRGGSDRRGASDRRHGDSRG